VEVHAVGGSLEDVTFDDEPLDHPDDEVEASTEELAAAAARPRIQGKGLSSSTSGRNLSYSAPSEDGSVKTTEKATASADVAYAGVPRNSPCPCGSRKKYKFCHGRTQVG
jgi:preprotein translocase subunit SecA